MTVSDKHTTITIRKTVYHVKWKNLGIIISGLAFILWFIVGGVFISYLQKSYENVCFSRPGVDASKTIIPLAVVVLFQGSWIFAAVFSYMINEYVPLIIYILFSLVPSHVSGFLFPKYDDCSMKSGGLLWLLLAVGLYIVMAVAAVLYGLYKLLASGYIIEREFVEQVV